MSHPLQEEHAAHPDEAWLLSATELGHRFRTGTLTPPAALESCIARIEEINPVLNAVVATRYAAARAEARAAAERIAAGDQGPLVGVPVTIKEFLGVRGMPNTGGLLERRHRVAQRNATVVERLRRAGAVIVGVTNAPEGGLWHETNNPVWGRTHNPHDPGRTPGGSSGGEGSVIAAGGVPLGIGSDTGGSIRIPAGFCGIVGHKPTGGLVPTTGHFPAAPGSPGDVPMVVGPLARTVADLRLALDVLSGPDGIDPQCPARAPIPLPLGADGRIDWSVVTVWPAPTGVRPRVEPGIEASVNQVAALLGERGARIGSWSGPDLLGAFAAWTALMAEISGPYGEIIAPGRTLGAVALEALRWPTGRSRHTGGVLAILALEGLLGVLPGRAERVAAARELRSTFDQAIGPTGLMICPVYPRTAPRHRAIAARDPRDVGCTALFNVTESPVTVVRAGTDRRGLPIGVQIVGARSADRLTLAAAEAIEEVLGVPSPVEPRRR